MIACVLVALMTGVFPDPGSRIPVPGSDQEILDRTLALVGGQAITLSDVRAAMVLGLVEDGPSSLSDMTNRLVDRELILREVQRYAPPAPAESAVEARFSEIANRFASPVAFMNVLETYGFTEMRLRAWLRDDLRTDGYLAQRFASAGTPERRRELVDDWLSDLRRRTDVVILPQ